MSNVTYSPIGNSGMTEVQLEGKNIGRIEREVCPIEGIAWVYRYWPNGCKSKQNAGSAFTSIEACKKSLEAE
jgi:hypothetical protein